LDPFGAGLRQAREARKLSLEDVALSTKIGVRFLKALEEEQFDKLPGGVFARSFTRAYARELGLNEQDALTGYLRASGGAAIPEPDLQQIAATREREHRVRRSGTGAGFSQLPWGIVSLALILAAVSLAFWGSRNRTPSAPATTSLPRAAAPQPSPSPVPSVTPLSDTVAAVVPTPSPASGLVQTSTSADVTASDATFEVKVKAREDAWISITADGQQIMQDILTAQTEKAIEARSQVIIRTGNVGALDFSFAGKKLPVQGDYGEVRTLTFDSTGLQPSLRKASISN